MIKSIRQSTLHALGLGSVLEIFQNGKLPVEAADMAEAVFGKPQKRGAMIISGANGIVGAGKAMQFGSRLLPYNIPIIALDFPGSPDGITRQYNGLATAFGRDTANSIMKNIIRLSYDGKNLPESIRSYNPKFLLEAIPEILDVKKAHYGLFKKTFPGIEIRSVTSGFPSSQLGVGIAHPAFPHEINKIWEIVEPKPSAITQLLWALGMIPIQVSDNWSFVLDVLFCGITHAGLQYHRLANTPFWKTDKYIRKLSGPNPFRAHDAIGAKGANFLTWSCLHHLGKNYGGLFTPTPELDERKETGQNWYPLDHFRPLVNWSLEKEDLEVLNAMILGPLFQMTALMVHEKRSHLSSMNAIGELCAQFTRGMPAVMRKTGKDEIIRTVKKYHALYPPAAETAWHNDVLSKMDEPEWQQLYVNAEHNGKAGVITISRESYNSDVDAELNRAITWLTDQKIKRVILTGDFHLSTQMVGADTNEFFPALNDTKAGEKIAGNWSATARRLYNEFEISVGFINGKRCMGGMLELMMHCHYLIAVDDAVLAMPEVTLPVVPGMEGCHWAVRKTKPEQMHHVISMLLEGSNVKAKDAAGWLVDFAGPLNSALKKAWQIMEDGKNVLPLRKVNPAPLKKIPFDKVQISKAGDQAIEEARNAIAKCIEDSCSASLDDALAIQAKHSAGFMVSKLCRAGRVGSEYDKVMV
ncbi:MAG: enoyl-CoA hydratase/isomerase family protein [Bacteroidetes bacterium]|nr:enoyl-CoA hydratase/isomerase family protein [Bacteroidota bacterium]